MKELIIDGNIIIDDAEAVATGIELLSGKHISSTDVFAKFATTEKATKFYLDSKCQCRMQPDRNTVYLWLDSGFTDNKE